MEYKIQEDTANKVLQYLATRPFQEVNELIGMLQKIEPITSTNEDTPSWNNTADQED